MPSKKSHSQRNAAAAARLSKEATDPKDGEPVGGAEPSPDLSERKEAEEVDAEDSGNGQYGSLASSIVKRAMSPRCRAAPARKDAKKVTAPLHERNTKILPPFCMWF